MANAGHTVVRELDGVTTLIRDRTPARPDRRVNRTRRALKDALCDLILEKGYEHVTVGDVLDRADVGRSTFYAHFVDTTYLGIEFRRSASSPVRDGHRPANHS